jgi:membrane fusion protein (multidrug efflux system)
MDTGTRVAEADPIARQGETASESRPQRRIGRLALMAAVPLLLLAAGFAYWQSLQGQVSTDNAYVKQDMVAVSAEVGGKIVGVRVQEDQLVEAGDLLFRIDPESYRLRVAETDAAIANARADVSALAADASLSGAEISAAREDVAFAKSRLTRQQALWERGFTTKADLDAAEHAVAQAEERLRLTLAQQEEARARLAQGQAQNGQNPRVAVAQAERDSADLDLRRTEIRAPINGRVTQADRLQPGQQILPNLPILTLVAEESSYVEANFRETELTRMKPGQPAEIRFDAYPDLVLKGHVASIGAGTGSEFSILPAQNATGNWVKVTQRVPVRIAIDERPQQRLIAGLSSEVTVFTDGRKR